MPETPTLIFYHICGRCGGNGIEPIAPEGESYTCKACEGLGELYWGHADALMIELDEVDSSLTGLLQETNALIESYNQSTTETLSSIADLAAQNVSILADTSSTVLSNAQILVDLAQAVADISALVASNGQILASIAEIADINHEILEKVFPAGDKVFRTYQILECIPFAEYDALSASYKDGVKLVTGSAVIDLTEGTRIRRWLLEYIFPEGTEAHTNILTLLGE
jgi:hypothetical protein